MSRAVTRGTEALLTTHRDALLGAEENGQPDQPVTPPRVNPAEGNQPESDQSSRYQQTAARVGELMRDMFRPHGLE